MFYVLRLKRATRREAVSEPAYVNNLLGHWKKLWVQSGLLYRVKKDIRLKKKLFQFVVPDSLKHQVLLGAHDNASHHGHALTLSCTRMVLLDRNGE